MTNPSVLPVPSFTTDAAPNHDDAIEIDGFQLYRYDPARHFEMINGWLEQSYASFWGMTESSRDERRAELAETPFKFGLIGYVSATPAFYIELYDPRHDEIGQHYTPDAGDCGMHVLMAPRERHLPGFTRRALTAIMQLIFSHFGFSRVVVEPDMANDKIHRLNRMVGIRYSGIVNLQHKNAFLGFANRADLDCALEMEP